MKEQIVEIVLKSLEELNLQLSEDSKLSISKEMPIFGKGGSLDSLDFVNLMVIVEDNIFETLGKSVTIVSDKAFSKKYNPFANVDRLSDFIIELLESEEA